jgi:hypothetical protein
MTREEELAAALLWLRNHYDVGDCRLKRQVLARADQVLAAGGAITGDHMRQLREKYPMVGA